MECSNDRRAENIVMTSTPTNTIPYKYAHTHIYTHIHTMCLSMPTCINHHEISLLLK